MPFLTGTHRYHSPPPTTAAAAAAAGSNLHETLADSKMQSDKSRVDRAELKGTPPPPRGPRNQWQSADSYRPSTYASGTPNAGRGNGGAQEEERPGGQGRYGSEGYGGYGGAGPGGGAGPAQPGWLGGYGYAGYGGYRGYQHPGYAGYQYRDYGYYVGTAGQTANQVQPSHTQPDPLYTAAPYFATGGQQHLGQPAYHQDLRPTTPARPGYGQDYAGTNHFGRGESYRPTDYRQQDYHSSPTYPTTPIRQREQAKYARGSPVYEQPASSGVQQRHGRTKSDKIPGNLNANAAQFQPQAANRVKPTAINFIPSPTAQQVARSSTKSQAKPKTDEKPHIQVFKRPEPSAAYLAQARQDWQTLDTSKPRQLLVVLDLNGTLLHRIARGGYAFAARPKVKEFLQYLLHNHKVMVWSSAKPENVQGMCKQLFTETELQTKLVAIWARDTLRIPAHAYNSKVQVYKRLSWVWQNKAIEAHHPDMMNGYWDQSNTVLIDDSVEKGASEPHNMICLEKFEDRQDQKKSDVLGQVVKYLEVLKWEGDVSAYMESLPFAYEKGEKFDWEGIAKN